MKKEYDIETNKAVIQQLRPHYIFNVLWNIQYLYKHEPKVAEKMLIDFSTFLRGKINDVCFDGLMPFEEEFELTRAYIEIEAARQPDKLTYIMNLDYVDFDIPLLVVQPVVENALKHGIFQKEDEGVIKVATYKDNDKVFIVVEDDGVGFDIDSLNKEECNNLFRVEERLKKFYPDGKVEINSVIDKGTKVVISFTQK